MIVSAIAAVAKNGVIGKGNEIPWYLPADLKYFKRKTLDHYIIMGRYSFLSIGRPLPKRVNIVVTRNLFFAASGCIVAHSIEDALDYARQQGEEEVFIIGGGQIYTQSLPLWDRLYLTEVDLEVPGGEVFFPDYEPEKWKLISEEAHEPDEKNEHKYVFKVLERK